MKSVHLQQNLEKHLQEIGLKVNKPEVKRLSLLSQSLAVSSNFYLSNLALCMPVDARRENLIQRLRRFLKAGEYRS